MPWQDQSRHFDTDGKPNTVFSANNADREIANATQDWKNGNQDAALDALGRALHSLQDIDAHQDYGADSGSITTPPSRGMMTLMIRDESMNFRIHKTDPETIKAFRKL
jgi:hypothetical protein